VSRFSRVRSEDDILDNLADSMDFGGIDENDPKSVAQFMKKMGKEMGEDMGDDFEEAMEADVKWVMEWEWALPLQSMLLLPRKDSRAKRRCLRLN